MSPHIRRHESLMQYLFLGFLWKHFKPTPEGEGMLVKVRAEQGAAEKGKNVYGAPVPCHHGLGAAPTGVGSCS